MTIPRYMVFAGSGEEQRALWADTLVDADRLALDLLDNGAEWAQVVNRETHITEKYAAPGLLPSVGEG